MDFLQDHDIELFTEKEVSGSHLRVKAWEEGNIFLLDNTNLKRTGNNKKTV